MNRSLDACFESYRQSELFSSFDKFISSLPESLSLEDAVFSAYCLVNQNTIDSLFLDDNDSFTAGILLGRSECYSAFVSILERVNNYYTSDAGKEDSSI